MSRAPFDASRLVDFSEARQANLPAFLLTPLVREPGRLVVSDRHLYFQPLNDIVGNTPVKVHALAGIAAVARRRSSLQHNGASALLKSRVVWSGGVTWVRACIEVGCICTCRSSLQHNGQWACIANCQGAADLQACTCTPWPPVAVIWSPLRRLLTRGLPGHRHVRCMHSALALKGTPTPPQPLCLLRSLRPALVLITAGSGRSALSSALTLVPDGPVVLQLWRSSSWTGRVVPPGAQLQLSLP